MMFYKTNYKNKCHYYNNDYSIIKNIYQILTAIKLIELIINGKCSQYFYFMNITLLKNHVYICCKFQPEIF